METAVKLYTLDTAYNANTKTIGNVNPAASDYVLRTFSEQLSSLSDRTLTKVERIDTKDVTAATQA